MTKFKVGDRVAVYGPRMRWALDGYGSPSDRLLAVVISAADESLLKVRHEGCNYLVHPKQCRRLKPRAKLREWHIVVDPRGEVKSGLLSDIGIACCGPNTLVRVREVRKKTPAPRADESE